ncbi:cytochrome c1 [Faunimonas pinastri]|nr:cytochrome c1 [Faunimonas pinastri]
MSGMLCRLTAALFAVGMASSAACAADQPANATPHYPLKEPHELSWSFSGPFGSFDKQQLQRGFKIYHDVCSNCHSLNLVAFRNLGDQDGLGFSAEQVKSLAAEYKIQDGPNDQGDMFERPGRPSDHLPAPFPNEQAARSANGGALPPDLSLLAKARGPERGFPWFVFDVFTQYEESAGPDYIYSLLTGFQDPPAGVQVREGLHYNPYFIASDALAMPPPLADGAVDFPQNGDDDKTNDVPQTVDQYARDVSAFLMWAAEPHLVERKRMGLTVMVFLIVFAGLVGYTKRRVWANTPH